ncbi:MAG TPA: hypothetical protein VE127_06855 [Solirubrobacteraceae bacterium]|nr:hypothetical protein [Solirubrobacteraceae bacterium]
MLIAAALQIIRPISHPADDSPAPNAHDRHRQQTTPSRSKTTFTTETQDPYSQAARELRKPMRSQQQPVNFDGLRRHLARRPDEGLAPSAQTQTRQELNLAFADLGGAAFALARQGALDDKRIAPRIRRILELFDQLDALDRAVPVD